MMRNRLLSMVLLLFADRMHEISELHICILGILILFICLSIRKIYFHKWSDCMKKSTVQDDYSCDEVNSVITLDDILGQEKNMTEKLIITDELQGMSGAMTEMQSKNEEKRKIQYIENPLPVPKRKEHKQMDFGIDILDENEDFDITDMTGMDFFDIE